MAGRRLSAVDTVAKKVFCDTVGCEQRAITKLPSGKNVCASCKDEEHRKKADAYIKAHNLNTAAECRQHCMALAKRWREPSFDTWARNMRQVTVDLMVRQQSTAALERLREACVIDGNNKVIPLEAREIARKAAEQERARRVVKLQEELQAHGIIAPIDQEPL